MRNFTTAEIEDIFETRAFIEEYAAKRAAKQATEEQLARMRKVLERMGPGQSLEEFVRLDKEFHGLVMDATGSSALKWVWNFMRMAEWTYLCAVVTAVSLDDLIGQHWRIFRYLESRGDFSAGTYMFLHIKGFRDELGRYFSGREERGTEV